MYLQVIHLVYGLTVQKRIVQNLERTEQEAESLKHYIPPFSYILWLKIPASRHGDSPTRVLRGNAHQQGDFGGGPGKRTPWNWFAWRFGCRSRGASQLVVSGGLPPTREILGWQCHFRASLGSLKSILMSC